MKNNILSLINLIACVIFILFGTSMYFTYELSKAITAVSSPLKIGNKETPHCQTQEARDSLDKLIKTTLE